MQSKKYLPEVTIIPASVAAEAGRFIQNNDVHTLSFWSKLSATKQQLLQDEIKQLAAARMMHASSGLAIGKHLHTIYNTCETYSGAFRKILRSFNFVERTAYRYMETYTNASEIFPDTILKAAMARGLNVLSYSKEAPLGKYTEVVRLLPPPKNVDTAGANRYIDQLEETYKDRKKALVSRGEKDKPVIVVRDRKTLLKDNFRGIRNALKVLPSRQRRSFLDDLFGMALTEMGIASSTAFTPEAIPEEFRQGPGYPKGRPRDAKEGTVAEAEYKASVA